MNKFSKAISNIILFTTFTILFSGCTNKNSVISSEPVNKNESLTSEKFNVESLKRIDLHPNESSIVFLDDSNILMDRWYPDSQAHDYYKLNINTGEESKFTDIDGEINYKIGSRSQNDNVLYTKDFKLMSYNVNTTQKTELYDLNAIKEIIQGKYSIDNDEDLNSRLKYDYVTSSNNYVYIYIEKPETYLGKVIFIDISNQKSIESEWVDFDTYYGFLMNPVDNLLYMGDRNGTFFSCDLEPSFKNNKLSLNTLKEGVYYNSSHRYISKEGRIIPNEYSYTNSLPKEPAKVYNIESGQWEQIKGIDWSSLKSEENIFITGYNMNSGIMCISKIYGESIDIETTNEYIGVFEKNSFKTLYAVKNDDNITYHPPMNAVAYNKDGSIIAIERHGKTDSGDSVSYIELLKIISN